MVIKLQKNYSFVTFLFYIFAKFNTKKDDFTRKKNTYPNFWGDSSL